MCSYFAHTARSPDATRRGGASQPNSAFSKSRECCEIALPFLSYIIHTSIVSFCLFLSSWSPLRVWWPGTRRMVRLIFLIFLVSYNFLGFRLDCLKYLLNWSIFWSCCMTCFFMFVIVFECYLLIYRRLRFSVKGARDLGCEILSLWNTKCIITLIVKTDCIHDTENVFVSFTKIRSFSHIFEHKLSKASTSLL